MLADLQAAGLEIVTTQAPVNLGGHLGGSADAVVSGVPEAPKKAHIAEFKTHNSKSFSGLINHGVEAAKPQHWLQMQLYMHGTGIDRALYLAVCKDDDRLYAERVRYDRAAAERAIERGHRITTNDRLPEPMYGAGPAYYLCKMCPAHHFCHVQGLTDQVNCRTCAHYTARPDGTNHCAVYDAEIPYDAQIEGCPNHVLHPDLAPWPSAPSPDGVTGAYKIGGEVVLNGSGGVSSHELVKQVVPF